MTHKKNRAVAAARGTDYESGLKPNHNTPAVAAGQAAVWAACAAEAKRKKYAAAAVRATAVDLGAQRACSPYADHDWLLTCPTCGGVAFVYEDDARIRFGERGDRCASLREAERLIKHAARKAVQA